MTNPRIEIIPGVRRPIAFAAVIAAVFGCTGGAWAPVRSALEAERLDLALTCYDKAAQQEGHDPEVVIQLAVLLLRQSVQSGDLRLQDAAITQLRMAASRGEATLRELRRELEPGLAKLQITDALVSSERDPERKRNLKNEIRAYLSSSEPSIVRIALRHAELGDRAALEQALRSIEPTVRAAGLRRLSKLARPNSQSWMLEQARSAMQDNDARVRRAAIALLINAGAKRGELFALFADADPLLQLEALRALSTESDLSSDQALLRLIAAQLVWPPSALGVAAAQVLVRKDALETHLQTSPIAALEYLQQVVHKSDDRSLRTQAAVALILVEPSLPLRHFLSALLARTDPQERDLRLQLSRALLRDGPAMPRAFSELQALLDRCDLPGVQAAGMLVQKAEGAIAMLGSEALVRCIDPIRALDTAARRTAARALGADAGEVTAARACLSDPDPLVRIFCAGGIVARAETLK